MDFVSAAKCGNGLNENLLFFMDGNKEPRSVTGSYTYEIPNFLEEAQRILNSKIGREAKSSEYEFQFSEFDFKGIIKVQAKDGNLEISNRIFPGSRNFFWNGRHQQQWGSHDVKCVLKWSIKVLDMDFECLEPLVSYGSVSFEKFHCTEASFVGFDKLDREIPEGSKNRVSLRVTAVVQVFEQLSGSAWIKVSEAPARKAIPLLQHLVRREHADVVIENDGTEFPVHSFALKCMSPVFATMLDTDMKEALSGRIKVEDVGCPAIERMLNFIYKGKFFGTAEEEKSATSESFIELLHCAEKYEISKMKIQVLTLMKSKLSTANAVKFAKAAELYGAETAFVEEILEFCKKNLSELSKGPELQEFVMRNIKNLY